MKLKIKYLTSLHRRKTRAVLTAIVIVVIGAASSAMRGRQAGAENTASVSPSLGQLRLTAPLGSASDAFGKSVAISGDTVIIGVPGDDINTNSDQGSAYVFVKSGTMWVLQQKLTADDGGSRSFGYSVAILGNTAIIGSWQDSIGANINQGAAYVFIRSGTNWTQQAKLIANDGAANDGFGFSAAISGETAIIGAIEGNSSNGAAYVFVRNDAVWTQQGKLSAPDGTTNDAFGLSTAISGDSAMVGAPGADINGIINQGAAYVFIRNGTTWSHQQKLFHLFGAAGDSVGTGVAISGDTAIVGAVQVEIIPNIDQGAAYVFTRSVTEWTLQQTLTANDGESFDYFGYSAAIDGDRLIIGAYGDNIDTISDQGSAYIFVKSVSTWIQQSKLRAADGTPSSRFGWTVGISGETAIVGAHQDDVGMNANQGSAYIFGNVSISRNTPFDFDGDSKTDISIFRPSNGEWWINRSSNGSTFAAQFGSSNDKITPGDFTGDGKTDIAFWQPSTGIWFVLRSEDSSFYSFPFGTNGDVPVPADYDADGKTDAAVFRPSTSTWFISRSTGGTTIQGFGQSGDVPVVSDYDGDGRADIAIYRVSLGEWWIQRSTAGVIAFQFGNSSDKPVQGDYTGDGKADVAFWRPSTGEWFVLRSENQSYYSFPFGLSADIPAPGDYDGDGKFDATVFRPSNSTWFVQKTTGGNLIQGFGQSGDRPVPNAFVP